MIIRCDRCDTEFSLDESQMREGGTAVRCSVCSHVFTAHPPDPRDVAHRPWQIRSEDGVLFSAKNLRVVANWISEARLTPNDEISRTGHRWRKLSEIPEFQGLLGLDNAPGIEVIKEAGAEVPEPPAAASVAPQLPSSPAVRTEADEDAKTLLSVPVPAKAKPKPSRRPDPAPIQGSIDRKHLPTEDESNEALEGLRADVKTLRSAPFQAPPALPRMSASIKKSVERKEQAELEAAEAAAKAKEEKAAMKGTRSGVSVSDMRSMFREHGPSPAELEAQASRKRAIRFAVASAGGALLVGGLLWWQSNQDTASDGPKEAAVVHQEPQASEDEQVSASRAALQAMDPAALRRMEAELHEQMQREDLGHDARARSKFLLIELLTERALQLSLAATLTDRDAQMLLDAARSDVMRARTLFEADPFKKIDPARRKIVQLRLEFAEGRPLEEIKPLLPETGATPTRALLDAAPLWRDAHDPVTPELLQGISDTVDKLKAQELSSMLLQEALAVAQLRGGQIDPARRWAKGRLESSISDPVARRIEDLALEQEEEQRGTGGAAGDTQAAGQTGAAARRPEAIPANASADLLMNRGCQLVERGASVAGIKLLSRALEKEPQDLDVMLCLAQGYARIGEQEKSLLFFERILMRSPRHRSALYGAATQAAAQGKHTKATAHYRKLLEVSPGHGPAEAYLEVHGGQ